MSMEAWIDLWVALLWGSGSAFVLVTLYILAGALRRAFGKGTAAKKRRNG